MRTRRLFPTVCLVLGLVGCGGASASPQGPGPGVLENSADAPAAEAEHLSASSIQTGLPHADSQTSPSAPPAPTPPKRERVRIHNSCSKPVKLHIERVNDSDLDTSITNSNEIEERASDGDEVRIVGDDNKVLATITILPAMKRVDVAASCSKLEGQ